MSDFGITGFGAYIPRQRLEGAAIAAAHRWMGPGGGSPKGRRAFCSWDEDAITMAVEAGRDCVARGSVGSVRSLVLASTTFPYADLLNASIVAGALALPETARLQDLAGSQRAGLSALRDGLEAGREGALLIASDRPRAKPGSPQELSYGAGAAAFALGSDGVIAKLVGAASVFSPMVDHFRSAEGRYDYYWEERWIRDVGYAEIAPKAAAAALAEAGLGIADIAHFVMAAPLRGAADLTAKRIGFTGAVADAYEAECGFCGAAHGFLMLAGVLERARPGERILAIGFGQGAEALVLEMTGATARPARGVAGSLADGIASGDYLRMLSFYDEIGLDWGMRAEKTGKAALTEQFRAAGQLAAFDAGRCGRCGAIQFPRLAYCVAPGCGAPAAEFTPYPLADEPARIVTCTADWLSYNPDPPLHVGFVQFDAGARLLMETVDVGPAGLEVGTRLRAVFRIKERDKVRGYNRYFWKMTPIGAGAG